MSTQRFTTSEAAHEAIDLIVRARKLFVTAHIAPDGDTIGSALGLYWALTRLGKEVRAACADPVPESFRFLPGADLFRAQPPEPDELLVIPDSSDPQRLGSVYAPDLFRNRPIVNIDHHVTNVRYGTVNWIEPAAASTAEIIVELVQALGVRIDQNIAMCLLTGIVTDTLVFRTSNTSADSLEAASRLMRAGASLSPIVEQTFNTREVSDLKLQGMILAGMVVEDGLIWADNTMQVRREAGAGDNNGSGSGTLLLSARTAQVSVIFIERDKNTVEVSFRARPGVDISRVAFGFGGGGHPQAAGCTLNTPLAEAHERVLPAIRAIVRARQSGRRT
jgi:bifunctional oligoribonuclease and PAP phosphatase NrnA